MSTKEYLPSEGRNWRNQVEDTTRYKNYKGPGPGICPRVDNLGPLYEAIGEQVKKASRIVASHWHGLLDAADVEQSIWLEISESSATAEKLRGADKQLLVDLLIRMGERICIKERNDYEVFTGNVYYSVTEVKAMAMDALGGASEDQEEMFDFTSSLEQLEQYYPHYAAMIIKRYGRGTYMETQQEKDYLNRGLDKLTEFMNRSHRKAHTEHVYGPSTGNRMPKGYDMYEGDWSGAGGYDKMMGVFV